MVLPAPVSPVTAVSPGCSSRVASSITPRPWILSSESTAVTITTGSDTRGENTPIRVEHMVERWVDRGGRPARVTARRAAPSVPAPPPPALDRQLELPDQPGPGGLGGAPP